MKRNINYRYSTIFIILVLAITTVQAPFSYLHYENPPFFLYFLITFAICFIDIITSTKFIIAEKIFYSFLMSWFALLFGTYMTEIILAPIYGYDSNYDILKAPILLENFLFYMLTTLFSIGLFRIWLTYRKDIYS